MNNSISDHVSEAWHQFWTAAEFEDVSFYMGVLVVLGFLIMRLGGFQNGGTGDGVLHKTF